MTADGAGSTTGHGDREQLLHGGVANAGAVVRVGDHVLRPATPRTPSLHRWLSALQDTGFHGVPRPVAIDPDGRERLVFVPGDVAVPPYPRWVQQDDALASVVELMRRFHAAGREVGLPDGDWSDEMVDPQLGECTDPVLCHNDVCLENVVFREGRAVALLDLDFAAPGRAVHDVAAMARMCVPVDDDTNAARLGWAPADRPRRLRLVCDVYGLDADGRAELLGCLDDAVARGGEFVRRHAEAGEPGFVTMWQEMGGTERFDRRRRWWAAHRDRFARTLS